MNHIRLSKTASPKCYSVTRNGVTVGYIERSACYGFWEVCNTWYQPISKHVMIKAAVSKAAKALS
jgi:hypothetical protein